MSEGIVIINGTYRFIRSVLYGAMSEGLSVCTFNKEKKVSSSDFLQYLQLMMGKQHPCNIIFHVDNWFFLQQLAAFSQLALNRH